MFSGNANLSQKIDRVVSKDKLFKKDYSLLVVKYSSGKVENVYEWNQKKDMIPASLTKIFTAGAILNKFPNDYKFLTKLASTSKVKNGVLNGDLYLIGDGDPMFVSESMWYLVNEFTRTGISKILGNIIVDDTKFDQVFFDTGRDPSRVDRAYDAPISAMTFNWSSVNVFIRPGERGKQASVTLDPANDHITLVNKTKTVSGARQMLKASRITDRNGRDKVIVTGTIGVNAPEKVFYKSISQPSIWAGENLKSFLKRRGIQINGEVIKGKAPSNHKILADVESKPILDIVKGMMKFSNNFIAEIMTKNLAAENKVSNITMSDGVAAINNYLKKDVGLKGNYKISSPSGLSRKNSFTVKQIVEQLVYLRKSYELSPEYLTANPISGIDGTLKHRLDKIARGRVRAKTGRLNGVIGLAGSVGSQNGEEYLFSFIFNGKYKDMSRSIVLIDKVLVELAK